MQALEIICDSCGKRNPATARFCYACGNPLVVEQSPSEPDFAETTSKWVEGDSREGIDIQSPELSSPPVQLQNTQPILEETPPPAYPSHAAPEGLPPVGYPPESPQQFYQPPKARSRFRLRCCAIGCLAVLLVLFVGLPLLHITIFRPIIEREIFKQIDKVLEDVDQSKMDYYGFDTEVITERDINKQAEDAWVHVPGYSDGLIYFQQDQIKLEVKIYGIQMWLASDVRVDSGGEFTVKSVKMHTLLKIFFTENKLKEEIANYANDYILRPRGLTLLAFQLTEGRLFVAYEGR